MTDDPHRDGMLLQEGSTLSEATGAMILLHGRGASATDIMGLRRVFDTPGVAYLAPEAAGHTWYPQSFLAPIEANEPYLTSALSRIGAVVRMAQGAGIPINRIVICGFSQGACLSTEFVARFPQKYGGLVAFTGGLIGPLGFKFAKSGNVQGMRAFFGSGDPDPHVPWSRVAESAAIMSEMGAQVTAIRYPGRQHTIGQDELNHAKGLVDSVFARDAGAK